MMTTLKCALPVPHAPDQQFEALIQAEQEPLGTGSSREVFSLPGRADAIMKVSINSNAANWAEFTVYHALNDQSLFGRIVSISESGKYLIMECLDDVPGTGQLPGVPEWFTDRKRENFGIDADGTIKVRDYANIGLRLGVLMSMPSKDETAEMKRFLELTRKRAN
jgi:hypothetical protein